jgi:5'-nucleotidase
MRILCTNDDGIHAPGLKSLERIARELSDDVWVVAPETDQSGVAHSLSLNDPLRLREISERHFAIKGTPTDCVIMGVRHLLKNGRPDLVLSGVNRGQNVAEDVSYSGTVAGAIEGTILRIPSIALSQAYGPGGRNAVKWECAERHAAGVVRKVLELGIPESSLVNVNFPDCAPDEVEGVATSVQGTRTRTSCSASRAGRRARQPLFLDRLRQAQLHAGNGTDLVGDRERRIA